MNTFNSYYGSYPDFDVFIEAFKRMVESLEKIRTEEAIEELLSFIRYTGGDYTGYESIYALQALDRIGGEKVLKALYTEFFEGFGGIDNELYITEFVEIIGKNNINMLIDILFLSGDENYDESIFELKNYIINAFGTLKNPIAIEYLIQTFVDESFIDSDNLVVDALIKINKLEKTTNLLFDEYNYFVQ
ncbi:unnamed protein product, partial [marine sediment metagenome]